MTPNRRQVLQLAAGAALLPLVTARPLRAQPGSRFVPPSVPMRYSRRLERTMADGAALTVSRDFAIRFVAMSGGYRVEGEQVAVSVDAPAKLEPFAALERARREQGLFPLSLSHEGLIFGARGATDTAELDAAVSEALAHYVSASQPGERDEIVRFINALHQSASKLVTQLPTDLFAPGPGPRTKTSQVALPGGESGAVTVRFAALADPLTGVMQEATREIVTALSEDRRRTVERWHLKPL